MSDVFRFSPGDWITIRNGPPEVHCRVPTYLRGRVGEVSEVVGRYRNPSLMALHQPGLPMLPLYRIRFRQVDLWGGPCNLDTLMADIYEHWLEIPKGN